MKKPNKKLLALLLTTVMAVSLLSISGFAAESDAADSTPCEHLYGTLTNNGDGTHTFLCAQCSDHVGAPEAHEYEEGFCMCGYVPNDPCPHTETTLVPGYAATCTTPGMTDGFNCADCGEPVVQQEEVPATGHKWQHKVHKDYMVSAPTCTEHGIFLKSCKYCGVASDIQFTGNGHGLGNKKGHSEGEAVVENNVPPTCDSDGSYDSVVYCDRDGCGMELSRETIPVPATGET